MASNVPRQPEKISADCPHCGFSQLESAIAKTTFCRKCGQHYSIERLLAKEAASLKAPSFFERLTKAVGGEKERTIQCHSCGHRQVVSTSAQSSLCPGCGSYIDLRDFKIDGAFGRSIQTQGEVKITAKGDLTSAHIGCGSARIEGKVRGHIVCTGEVSVKIQGKLAGTIDTEKLTIEKKCDVEFVRPVKARAVAIVGKALAVMHCDGCVTVEKGGILGGTIYAKAVNFEHGGIFIGQLRIGQMELDLLDTAGVPADVAEDDADDLLPRVPARPATARRA